MVVRHATNTNNQNEQRHAVCGWSTPCQCMAVYDACKCGYSIPSACSMLVLLCFSNNNSRRFSVQSFSLRSIRTAGACLTGRPDWKKTKKREANNRWVFVLQWWWLLSVPPDRHQTLEQTIYWHVFYFMLFVYVVRRRTCNNIRIIFVVTWLVLKWTNVQYFVGEQYRNPFEPSMNLCCVVWWCIGRLWAYVFRWATNNEECELWHIEHGNFEIETTWNCVCIHLARSPSSELVWFTSIFDSVFLFLATFIAVHSFNLLFYISRKKMPLAVIVNDDSSYSVE